MLGLFFSIWIRRCTFSVAEYTKLLLVTCCFYTFRMSIDPIKICEFIEVIRICYVFFLFTTSYYRALYIFCLYVNFFLTPTFLQSACLKHCNDLTFIYFLNYFNGKLWAIEQYRCYFYFIFFCNKKKNIKIIINKIKRKIPYLTCCYYCLKSILLMLSPVSGVCVFFFFILVIYFIKIFIIQTHYFLFWGESHDYRSDVSICLVLYSAKVFFIVTPLNKLSLVFFDGI